MNRKPVNSSSPGNPDTADVTEALSAPVFLTASGGESAPFPDEPAEAQPADEPFIPRKRYTPGRSTKVLVCVLVVVAGFFGGSMVQKQLDMGARGARTNVGNFQGTNGRSGAGNGNNAGTQTPGQGRRSQNNGAAPVSAPAAPAGQ